MYVGRESAPDRITELPLAKSTASTATLSLTGITKKFAGVAALTDVDLTVRPGEVHALLGENGAGKSTLMNVATGTYQPDAGTIVFEGQEISTLTPNLATKLGIAIVHQHPAVMEDLSVEDNLRAALPSSFFSPRRDAKKLAKDLLESVGLNVDLRDRVENLSVAQKHLLEIAKAFALKPRLLILDEPTAPLGKESVDLLFARVRKEVAAGVAVVYITHRLAEVREMADRVTVLRDGKMRGVSEVSAITDDELLTMIIGRELEQTFPPKVTKPGDVNFRLRGFTGVGFKGVDVESRRGEILGISGVVGNGQSDVMKTLAGLSSFTGTVEVGGVELSSKELLNRSAYLPADRLHEGLAMTLSVRENAAISALRKFTTLKIISGARESKSVLQTLNELAVKAPSAEANVSSLSGGNQQKVVMARALLSEPVIVVADEPTQGVDVGARAEIYRLLREISASGVPVIVNSSDAKELEGLCDQVIVLSRGHVVDNLRDKDLTESRMIKSAVTATTQSVSVVDGSYGARKTTNLGRFLGGDYAPSALLVIVMLLLGTFILTQNGKYLNDFNINSILGLATALGFIAIGQTVALLIGGIDLSVGPLAGLLVVVASFFINDGSPIGSILTGLGLMLVVALLVGLLNGSMIRYLKFTAIAATLTMYIALQGVSFLLRESPDGFIAADVSDVITAKVGPLPIAFLVLAVVAVVLEWALRNRRWGWNLRATGSNEESARRIGINVNRTVILAYVASSFFAFAGAIYLLAQLGVGDPAQGVSYTLASITAVVLGGTSLLGGRGSFIGTVLGAVLLIQVMNAIVFLGLTQMWTYVFQGLLILVAAVVYSVARNRQKQKQKQKGMA
jgi:ribose transport system ATP-binding protein